MKVYLYKINGVYYVKTDLTCDLLIDGKLVREVKEGQWIGPKPTNIKVKIEDNTYEDVEIVEYDITGRMKYYPYIVPLRLLGGLDTKDGEILYRYEPNPYRMAKEIAEKYGFEEVDDPPKGKYWYVSPSWRGEYDALKYMEINGHYVRDKVVLKPLPVGTWEECYERYKSDYERIEKLFLVELAKIEEWRNLNLGEFIDFLIQVEREVDTLPVKVAGRSKKWGLLKDIREMKEKLDKLLKEELKRREKK